MMYWMGNNSKASSGTKCTIRNSVNSPLHCFPYPSNHLRPLQIDLHFHKISRDGVRYGASRRKGGGYPRSLGTTADWPVLFNSILALRSLCCVAVAVHSQCVDSVCSDVYLWVLFLKRRDVARAFGDGKDPPCGRSSSGMYLCFSPNKNNRGKNASVKHVAFEDF